MHKIRRLSSRKTKNWQEHEEKSDTTPKGSGRGLASGWEGFPQEGVGGEVNLRRTGSKLRPRVSGLGSALDPVDPAMPLLEAAC